MQGATFNEMIPERKESIVQTEEYILTHFNDSERPGAVYEQNVTDIMHSLVYKDDTWNHINNLYEYMDCIFHNKEITIPDNEMTEKRYTDDGNTLKINSQNKENNWVCFFYTPQYNSYKLEFEFVAYSDLEEIQVAFKYKNLGERYRFMVRNECDAVFECVHRGIFYWDVRKKDYSLKKGEKYKITVEVCGQQYRYLINDELIFSIEEDGNLIDGNQLLMIFYNKDANDGVRVDLTKCEISYIKDNL